MSGLFSMFKKKKPERSVRDKLEETMNQSVSPMQKQGSFFAMTEADNTISDSDGLETMSVTGPTSGRDQKFMNMMEVLNNPEKQVDMLTTLNDFFSSNLTAISNLVKARKLHHAVSKSISAESFNSYIHKLGKINSTINKTREQDKRDKEQYEKAFTSKYQLVVAKVDKDYFNRDQFSVSLAKANKATLADIFDDLETKTDLIDDALHFGIKARFNNYLDAMSEFKAVEDTVVKQIESIQMIRQINSDLNDSMLIVKDKIVKKKKLAAKKRAVLDILEMFEQINNNLNTIESLLEAKSFSDAVAIYKKQEEMLYNKLKGYCLSEKIEGKLNTIRSRMIQEVNLYFKEVTIAYLTECFLFSKKKTEGTGDASRLIQDMTVIANSSMNMSMDFSVIERFEQNSVPLYLLGNFEPKNTEDIESFAQIISNFLSIKDFRLEGIEEEIIQTIRNRVREVIVVSSSKLSEYMQEIFNSHLKQVNIVSALIIANTIFERFITRFSHIFSELTERILKKFYASMRSKFLQNRMSVSSLNVFEILINLKMESIEVFEDCKKTIFMNETNLKRIDNKDFVTYQEIIDIFNSNLEVLFRNNLVVANEQKLDKSIVDKYTASLNTIQGYEYKSSFNRLKLIEDYFKAYYNAVSQALNSQYSHEKWQAVEADYQLSDIVTFILNGKYLKTQTDNILNESNAVAPEIKTDDTGLPVLIYKNELHVDGVRYQLTGCFWQILQAVKDFLVLGSNFVDIQEGVAIVMIKRVLDLIVVFLGLNQMSNSMTTQYILSGGAVICNLVEKITYDHLGMLEAYAAIALSQMRLTEVIITSVQEKLKTEGVKEAKLDELFKKVLFDLQTHSTSIQTKWTDMFTEELMPTIEKSVEKANKLKSTTHLPTDETSQILSRMKQMQRYLADLNDQATYTQLFDRFIEKTSESWVGPFWQASKADEATSKRAREELVYAKDNLAEIKDIDTIPAFARLTETVNNLN